MSTTETPVADQYDLAASERHVRQAERALQVQRILIAQQSCPDLKAAASTKLQKLAEGVDRAKASLALAEDGLLLDASEGEI